MPNVFHFTDNDIKLLDQIDIPILIDIDCWGYNYIKIISYLYNFQNSLEVYDIYCDLHNRGQKPFIDVLNNNTYLVRGENGFRVGAGGVKLDKSKPYLKLSTLHKLIFEKPEEHKINYINHIQSKKYLQQRQLKENITEMSIEHKLSRNLFGDIQTLYIKIEIPNSDTLSFRYHYIWNKKEELQNKWIIKCHRTKEYIAITETELGQLCKELNLDKKQLPRKLIMGRHNKRRFVKIVMDVDNKGIDTDSVVEFNEKEW